MWRFVKWPKLAAVACFFLPWLTMSCSNKRIAAASGWDLIAGRIAVVDPLKRQIEIQSHVHSWWIALALFLTIAGVVIAFRRRPRPVTVLATSVVAVLAILLASSSLTDGALIGTAAKDRSGTLDAATTAFRVDWQPGYWATLAMLCVAIALAALSWNSRVIALRRTRRYDRSRT